MIKKIFRKKKKNLPSSTQGPTYSFNRFNIQYCADKKRCDGKVALVLGASSGIGKSCAISLAKNGAKVILAARREELLIEAVKEINHDTQSEVAKYVLCDVSDINQIKQAVDFTVRSFGKIDIAVNNFGVSGGQRTIDSTTEYYDNMMNINFKGVVFAMRYEIEQMLKQSNCLSSIINIGSTLSTVGMENLAVYCGSKHAIAGATKAVVLERYPNIRVNCVCPGAIRTVMFGSDRTLESEFNQINSPKGYPVGHIGEPEEVASVVTFLASDEASFVNGAIIPVDGGFISN